MSQFKIIPLNTAQIPSLMELSNKTEALEEQIKHVNNTEQITKKEK